MAALRKPIHAQDAGTDRRAIVGLVALNAARCLAFMEDSLEQAKDTDPGLIPATKRTQWDEELVRVETAIEELRKDIPNSPDGPPAARGHSARASSRPGVFRASSQEQQDLFMQGITALGELGIILSAGGDATSALITSRIWARRRAA